MSTTHPTNITTEWDDLQRKYGNLPKLEKEKTNEERDSHLVEVMEQELLRESRLKDWKKKIRSKRQVSYGSPVPITEETFIEQVTNGSKLKPEDCDHEDENNTTPAKIGYYVPVLLLDESRKESVLLKKSWGILAKRHPEVKFTIGSVQNVVKCETSKKRAPSSILLYFAGACVMQKHASTILQSTGFEFAENTVEDRVADAMEILLNSAAEHLLFPTADREESDSSSSSDDNYLRSSGKSLKRDFLHGMLKQRPKRNDESDSEYESHSKTYTSWIMDEALGK